jgi:hypothetical protein
MKKMKLLILLFFCMQLSLYSQVIGGNAQAGEDLLGIGTISIITEPYNLRVSCDEYTNNLTKGWHVNNVSGKRLRLDYLINIENNNDIIKIYEGPISNSMIIATLTGLKEGTIYIYGEMTILFITNGSVSGHENINCNYYSSIEDAGGFQIDISEGTNGTVLGDITVNGTVTGNLEGGVLRVQTHHGYLDLGPQNTNYAHLSTDRDKFLFNKPVYLEDGKLSSDGANKDMALQTNGTSRMTIQGATGFVGIGTTNPSVPLEVNGDVKAKSLSLTDNLTAKSLTLSDDLAAKSLTLSDNLTAKSLTLSNNMAAKSLILSDNLTAKSLTLSGNLGIGTNNPENKLDVNGTIRAKEINISTGWADFVFANDYQLPALNEVKRHIDEHKHLPGIPTETEVKENGVNLGEMQTKLLQKVEELTLYLIQQDHTIQELKAEIRDLKEK